MTFGGVKIFDEENLSIEFENAVGCIHAFQIGRVYILVPKSNGLQSLIVLL